MFIFFLPCPPSDIIRKVWEGNDEEDEKNRKEKGGKRRSANSIKTFKRSVTLKWAFFTSNGFLLICDTVSAIKDNRIEISSSWTIVDINSLPLFEKKRNAQLFGNIFFSLFPSFLLSLFFSSFFFFTMNLYVDMYNFFFLFLNKLYLEIHGYLSEQVCVRAQKKKLFFKMIQTWIPFFTRPSHPSFGTLFFRF